MHSQKSLKRLVTGLAAAALALTGCSSGAENAQFEDTEQNTSDLEPVVEEETRPELPEAESGLLHDEMSQDATVLETFTPEHDSIVTPAGTLTVEEVEVVESVSAGELAMDSLDAEERVGPASNEEFRILNLSFESDEAIQPGDPNSLDVSADLAIEAGGQRNHIAELNGPDDYRMLISAPQDGDVHLVVSSEGHDQHIDVLSGERAVDEQDPAAAYYREVTHQDLNHTFPLEDHTVALDRNGSPDEGTVQQDARINWASLTAWTEESGWADEGQAWLQVDWRVEVENGNNGALVFKVQDIDVTLTAEFDGQTETDNVNDAADKWRFSHEHTTNIPVEHDLTDVALSFDGAVGGIEPSVPWTVAGDGSGGFDFSTDELAVEFPMDGNTDASTDDAEEPTDSPQE